jgi:nicotinate-nucleotide adenylyltransferase
MVVLTRDDDAVAIPDGAAPLRSRRVDVSSTEIRARVAARQSLRGFVPDPVAAYIADERLYR